jgi:hypothetical protein
MRIMRSAILVFFAAAMTMSSILAQDYHGENLFFNPQFDLDADNNNIPDGLGYLGLNGWPDYTRDDQFFLDETNGRNGGRCLRVDLPAHADVFLARSECELFADNSTSQTRIAYPAPGTTYTVRLEFWAKSNGAPVPPEFEGWGVLNNSLQALLIDDSLTSNATNYNATFINLGTSITTTYQHYSGDFRMGTPPDTITPEIILSDYPGDPRTEVFSLYIDDVKFYLPDLVPPAAVRRQWSLYK